MAKVSNGGREEILNPIKKDEAKEKQYKIQNPTLDKAKRMQALIASFC